MKCRTLLAVMLISAAGFAQEFRATLTGRLTDTTGAVIPHATVSVTNESTGALAKTTTGGDGYYTVPYLQPGKYRIAVTVSGFKPYVNTGYELLTDQTLTQNIALELGAATDTVTVSSGSPLIDTATATTGQVLTEEEINDLPSNGRNPLGFARDAYGAVPKMKHATASAEPFQNSTADDFSLGGGLSASNELLLNGVPNMQDGSRTAGYSPFMDAVNTIRVDEFNANASVGDTSGGTVDITTKGGGNSYHGSVAEFYQDSTLGSAKPFLNTTVVNSHFSQFGATIGGPIRIPHVFDGRNKLFFFYAYEGYVGSQPPTSVVGDVPTCAERGQTQGSGLFCTDNAAGTPDYPDFSALLALGSTYQLYDPYAYTGNGTAAFARTTIPNNQFANAINATGGTGIALTPLARNLLGYIPAPNSTGTADGENNYTTLEANPANYKSHSARIDWNISNANKIFAEVHRSKYLTSGSDYFHDLASGTITDVILAGGVIDDVHTFSPTLSLDVRGGMQRYTSVNSEKSAGFNYTSLGYPSYLQGNSTAVALPVIKFTDATSPLSIGSTPGSNEFTDNLQFFAMVTKVLGKHTLKGGVDVRANKQSQLSPGTANGSFTFANQATSNPVALSNTAKPATYGSAFALFDLGLPTGGSQGISSPYQYNNFYSAYFVQDDWKVTPTFSVSVGLRLEHETPVTESNNRMVIGFNPTAVNEATTISESNYATAYTAAAGAPDLPSSINTAGGVTYAGSGNRSAYSTAVLYISPRLGMTWAPEAFHGKLAIKAGFGVYNNPFGDYNFGQTYGFSGASTFVQNGTVTTDAFTPYTTLSDPFPNTADPVANPIIQPTGNSLGYNQSLGAALTYYAPVKVPYSEHSSFDVQYQFAKSWMIEMGYIGNHTVHLSYSNLVSAIPQLPYLYRGAYDSNTVTTNLSSTGTGYGVTNPFKGVAGITGGLATSPKLAAFTALQAYPEYSSVTQSLTPGSSSLFNAWNARVYKRMSNGLDLNVNTTYSKLTQAQQLNSADVLVYQNNSSDFPWKVNVTAIYQLPIGKGRKWLNKNFIVDEVIGGWQVTGIYGYLSGAPLSWGNSVYQGDGSWKDFHNNPHYYSKTTPSFNTNAIFSVNANTAAIYNQTTGGAPNAYNYRTFPLNLLRQDHQNNADLSIQKNFQIFESAFIQARFDGFNAFNHPQFAGANVSPSSTAFGEVTSVQNTPRLLQGGLHLFF